MVDAIVLRGTLVYGLVFFRLVRMEVLAYFERKSRLQSRA